MGAPLAGGLLVQGRFPLDDKYWVSDITKLETGLVYDGLVRFTKDTQLTYIRRFGQWEIYPKPSTGGGAGSSIAILNDHLIEEDGEQIITLQFPANKILSITVLEGGVRTRVLYGGTQSPDSDYYVTIKGVLVIKASAKLVATNYITVVYDTSQITGDPNSGGDSGSDGGMTANPLLEDIVLRLSGAESDITDVQMQVQALSGSQSGTSDRWIPTKKWIDAETIIDEDNQSKLCDNILYRRVGVNQYEKREIFGNQIDMSLYLSNFRADDNSDAWEEFDAYIGQAKRYPYLTLVFPNGEYSFSRTIHLTKRRYTFLGAGGEIFFTQPVTGFFRHNAFGDEYRFINMIITCINMSPSDGMVKGTDPTLQAFVDSQRIPVDRIKINDAGTRISDLMAKQDLMVSLNPFHYSTWAILTTGVTYVDGCIIKGFGAGIFFYAPSVGTPRPGTKSDFPQWENTYMTVDGYDCSMSTVNNTVIRQCRGAAIAMFSADANQIRVNDSDTRECGIGIQDMSQSGSQIDGHHSAVNLYGDFHMYSNGSWNVAKSYSETDSRGANVFAGEGTWDGGPLKSNNVTTSGDVLVRIGSYLSNLRANLNITDQIGFLGADRFSQFTLTPNTPKDAWNMTFGGSPINGNVFGFRAKARGTQCGITTQSISNNGKTTFVYASSISSFLTEVTGLWEINDQIDLGRFCDPHGPREYVCVGYGVTGGLKYNEIENITVVNVNGNPQSVRTVGGPTSIFTLGSVIIINGQYRQIVNIGTDAARTYSDISLSFPGVDLAGGVGTISLPQASFRAIGSGVGTTAQRPNYLNPQDDGWQYKDTTIKKMIMWNGDGTWTDLMGNIV